MLLLANCLVAHTGQQQAGLASECLVNAKHIWRGSRRGFERLLIGFDSETVELGEARARWVWVAAILITGGG
jgi:hypothetical protein